MAFREQDCAALMRAARGGDQAAYDRCLREMAQALRGMVRGGLLRAGTGGAETEDVVQDILIAVHLKRHTWDDSRPIGPWLAGIARYKVIDTLRKRGRRVELPIEDFAEVLPAPADADPTLEQDVQRSLSHLPDRQRAVVSSIAVEGSSIAQTAGHLKMTEGAVRVALHRGLAALAKHHGQPS